MLRVIACPHCDGLIETDQVPGRPTQCPYCQRRFATPDEAVESDGVSRGSDTTARFLIPLGYAAFVLIPMAVVIYLAVQLVNEKPAPAAPVQVAKAPEPPPAAPRPVRPLPPTSSPGDNLIEPRPLPEPRLPPVALRPITPEPRDPPPDPEPATAPAPRVAVGMPEPPVVSPPEMTEPTELAIAPAPRTARPALPVPAGFASDWKKVGTVEARVAGVAVERMPITDADGRAVLSPVPVLAVYVEVRNDPKGKALELRRWQDALGDHAKLTTHNDTPIAAAGLGPGASLRTPLPYKQPIPTDGGVVLDVVVFAAPSQGLGELVLSLDADRVGLTGEFKFRIPESAYKK